MSGRKRDFAATRTLIGPYVKKFLNSWIPQMRGHSKHTRRSYEGMFKALAAYMDDRYGVLPSEVTFDMLDEDTLLGFVNWLLEVRGLKPSSVNTRLGALKSFAKFIEYELPSEAPFCALVRRIKLRKVAESLPKFMEHDALAALFDEAASRSLRDLTILELLYASGARESEFIAITPRDIRFNKKDGVAAVELHGKGGKSRVVKIGRHATTTLRLYMGRFCSDPDEPLFTSRRGEPLSASGLAWIVKNCANLAREKSPGCVPNNVHPHMFRHSIATHMLRSGSTIEEVRLFLGHSSYKTTAIYAKCDPNAVSDAVAVIDEGYIKEVADYDQAEKDDLDDWDPS